MNRLKLFFLFIMPIGFCAQSALADTIMLRDNIGQLIGKIIAETADAVVIDVSGALLSAQKQGIQFIIQNGARRDFQAPSQTFNSANAYSGINAQNGDSFTSNAFNGNSSMNPAAFPHTETPVSMPGSLPPGFVQIQKPGETSPFSGVNASALFPQTETPATLPLLPVALPGGKAYQVIGAGVRFRQGPSALHPIVSALPGRSVLLEMEIVDGWLHAKTLEGVEGWIHPNFVRELENQPCIVTGDGVNVREAPGVVYRSLDRIRKGEVVVKLEEQQEWWLILSSESTAGWCDMKYLAPLADPAAYKPAMKLVRNTDAGLPILIEKSPEANNQTNYSFTVRDDQITMQGMTNLCVFHREQALFDNPALNYIGEGILKRKRLASPDALLKAALPQEIASAFIGADVLSLLGVRAADGWQFQVALPESPGISFAFVVQNGPNRGAVILLP